MAKVLVQPTQKFPRMCAEVNDSSSRGSYDVVTDKVVRRSMRLLLQQEGFGHERLFDSIDPNEDRRGETGELVQAVAERIKFLLKDQPNSLSSINDLTENQWIIHTGNVHSEYIRVAHLLFSDNVNWGRVVTLIGFSANYCLYAVQQGIMESIVESVCGWAVSFMERELNDWFSRNSWEQFLTFADRRLRSSRSRNEDPIPSWQSIVTLGAIGGVAAAVMFLRHAFS